MNYVNRRRNSSGSIKKTVKNYIVPIIGVLLVIILFVFLFRGGDPEKDRNTENQVGINVSFDSDISAATLVFPGDYKKDIEGDSLLYKGEKVIVKDGSVTLKLDGQFDFKVNKLGELKYLENGSFEVTSGEVWVNAYTSMNVGMNFANLRIDPNTHLSLSQNEMGSTIYLITGFVEVSNLASRTTVLAPGETITISRENASNTDVDLSPLKVDIDQFFVKSDWYILNKGSSFAIEDITGTGENGGQNSGTGGVVGGKGENNSMLAFTNLIDSSNVSASSINISGIYNNDQISKITVNGKEAVLDKAERTFRFENVSVANRENDLVFKVMDASNDVLSKFVYTIYYSGGATTSNNTSGDSANFGNPQIYDVNPSQFTFTAPTTGNTYTTNENDILLRGVVLAKGIDSVVVNGYKLSSYETTNGTWRYNARTILDNLSEGTNVYTIQYMTNGNVVYTNTFTIVKGTGSSSTTEDDPTLGSKENPEPVREPDEVIVP